MSRIFIRTITPEGLGTYSGWEIHQAATTSPERMIFAAIGDLGNQTRDVDKITDGLRALGVTVCESLEEVAAAINARYNN